MSKNKRAICFYNKHSGSADSISKKQIRSLAKKHSFDVTFETLPAQHRPIPKTKRNTHADVLLAAGGDGTVASVAARAMQNNIPLGILPIGTANVLARNLSIPIDPIEALLHILKSKKTVAMDTMMVDKKVYLLHISAGISAHTMKRTPRSMKQSFGWISYVFKSIQLIFTNFSLDAQIRLDNDTYSKHTREILIANSPYFGISGQRVHHAIKTSDGKLDVLVSKPMPKLYDYLHLAVSLVFPQRRLMLMQHIGQAKKIRITSPVDIVFQGDGDIIGNAPITISVRKKALKIYI